MDEVRRIAETVMDRHPEAFGPDYEKNKKALEDLALIPSKQLRNHIAGYITKAMKEDTVEPASDSEEDKAE